MWWLWEGAPRPPPAYNIFNAGVSVLELKDQHTFQGLAVPTFSLMLTALTCLTTYCILHQTIVNICWSGNIKGFINICQIFNLETR